VQRMEDSDAVIVAQHCAVDGRVASGVACVNLAAVSQKFSQHFCIFAVSKLPTILPTPLLYATVMILLPTAAKCNGVLPSKSLAHVSQTTHNFLTASK
jgi:hypothetical protein